MSRRLRSPSGTLRWPPWNQLSGKAIWWALVTPKPPLSISAVFESMKALGERHRPVLVRVTIASAALSTATVPLQLSGTLGLAIALGLGLLLRTAYAGMAAALVCLPGEKESAGELWTAIRPVLSSLIWVSLLVSACAAITLILIIPPLILMTIWSVVIPVIVAERTGVFGSLARSRELVRGNGWRVFGFMICLTLITILIGLLGLLVARPFGTGVAGLMVGNFILICVAFPLLLGGPAVLYRELTRIEGKPEPGPISAA